MLLGLALFWVGAVLCLNGIWLLGRIGDREIAVIDVFVGFVTLLVSLFLAFGPGANAASIKAAALTLLFTFTYFWVAWNRWNGADGRGLGWFCLFVAITTIPVFLQTFAGAHDDLGRLVRHLLAVLGRALVPVLPDPRPRLHKPHAADRRGLRVAGRLYRMDPGLPAAQRRDPRRAARDVTRGDGSERDVIEA